MNRSGSGSPRTLRAVFNVGGSEFLMIALVALLVLGPERMPAVVRKAGLRQVHRPPSPMLASAA